jgi:hypothetical protein
MSAGDFGKPEQTIYIPARELTGCRGAKLAALDEFLAQLAIVRLMLCGQTVPRAAGGEEAPPPGQIRAEHDGVGPARGGWMASPPRTPASSPRTLWRDEREGS